MLADFLEGFAELLDPRPTVDEYRLWAGVSLIAAALGRRCYLVSARMPLYPVLFIKLVGEPGVGKDVSIGAAESLARSLKTINIGPVSISHKGLIDAMCDESANSTYFVKGSSGMPVERTFQQLYSIIPELGTALPEYSSGILSLVNDLYVCKSEFEDKVRGGDVRIITEPCLNILWGTQPDYMASLFKEEAYGMGFFSRVIMVYTNNRPVVELFGDDYDDEDEAEVYDQEADPLYQKLLFDLREITKLQGRFKVPKETRKVIEHWEINDRDTELPTHNKLRHYNARRTIHLLKLSMVFSASRSNEMIIRVEDWERAHSALISAEKLMPQIFSSMSSSRGDGAHMDELEAFISDFTKKHQVACPEHQVIRFLSRRVPSQQILNIIDQCIASRMIKVVGERRKERLFKPFQLTPVS